MISWEMAMDWYGVTRYQLEMLAISSNPKICDNKKCLVKDMWGNKSKKGGK